MQTLSIHDFTVLVIAGTWPILILSIPGVYFILKDIGKRFEHRKNLSNMQQTNKEHKEQG